MAMKYPAAASDSWSCWESMRSCEKKQLGSVREAVWEKWPHLSLGLEKAHSLKRNWLTGPQPSMLQPPSRLEKLSLGCVAQPCLLMESVLADYILSDGNTVANLKEALKHNNVISWLTVPLCCLYSVHSIFVLPIRLWKSPSHSMIFYSSTLTWCWLFHLLSRCIFLTVTFGHLLFRLLVFSDVTFDEYRLLVRSLIWELSAALSVCASRLSLQLGWALSREGSLNGCHLGPLG